MSMKPTNKRSNVIFKNIGLSLVGKMLSLLASLLVVPLTIDYINPTRYGIWLALSSIIAWIGIVDLGLGHGFRNKLASALANKDILLSKQLVSTTYIFLSAIIVLVYLLLLVINYYIDWSSLLNIERAYQNELHIVFLIVAAFFCLKLVVGVFYIVLYADQKAGVVSIIQGVSNALSLLAIFFLTKYTEGSLVNLALFYSGVPAISVLFISILSFIMIKKYKEISPSFSYLKTSLIKGIFSLGLKFFLINICMIIIFQISNLVISREIGQEEVTEYNISYKYFNILYIIANVIVNPFWSAFTQAYVQKDFEWMKRMVLKLEKVWILSIAIGLIMLLVSPLVYKIWLNNKISINFTLNIVMAIFYSIHIIASIYMYLINGLGTVKIQLIIYVIGSFLSWPFMVYSCRLIGLPGIVLFPAIVYLAQAILTKIQLTKILNHKASGIWLQ